ncbi:hypothetical protein [Tritonibacter mobilis]|uniref:hypothetical protein n=1 Tax=Tritonibacter mobilis TaxID=379347 RepID=UPI003A5C55A0
MVKFELSNPPHTVAGEAERMIRAHMWCHDNHQYGVGGYYLTADDVKQLRAILGEDFDAAMRGAGFEPDPRPRRSGWWTGPRSPAGDGARIRLQLKLDHLRAVVGFYGDRQAA